MKGLLTKTTKYWSEKNGKSHGKSDIQGFWLIYY